MNSVWRVCCVKISGLLDHLKPDLSRLSWAQIYVIWGLRCLVSLEDSGTGRACLVENEKWTWLEKGSQNTLRICDLHHLEVACVPLKGGRGGSPGLAELSSHSLHSSALHRELFVPSSFVFPEELAGLDPFVPFDFCVHWTDKPVGVRVTRVSEMPNILITAWEFEVVEEDFSHDCGYSRLTSIYF